LIAYQILKNKYHNKISLDKFSGYNHEVYPILKTDDAQLDYLKQRYQL
jgi:hypothetical protein